MSLGKLLKPSGFWAVAFVISIFILFFIGSISLRQIQALSASQDSVTRSHKVRIDLEHMFSELKDAETAQRGFIITRDEHYLEPYNYAHVRINKALIGIKSLTKNNPNRQKEIDRLTTLINERFRLMRDNLLASNRMAPESEAFKRKMLDEKKVMDEIRVLVDNIIKKEAIILDKQEKNHGDEISITPLTSLLLVVFSVIVFLFSFLRINHDLRQMKKLNRSLQLMNETFTDAERIGEISHWQFDPASRKFWFSDNKYRILGMDVFEPTLERFLQIVHPSDRRKVRNSLEKLSREPHSIYYRIRRPDKKVRYIRSVSKLSLDSEGNEILIGVDADVTAQHKNTLKLERRNQQLKSSNDELSSFNHIVSHDLQEPLRKIQMFISRIDESELAKLSDSTRSYIARIHSSANRAQRLIDDLLIYSRLSRNDKKPELCDLNSILENAKIDLSQVIEESNAQIIADALPTIKVVCHQIQQLFLNLLSNSLKYSKEQVPPVIKISYGLSTGSRIAETKLPAAKQFHVLTFTDNGIGFDQSYSERIFVLFHRLHDKEQYSGTGMGLAICKKMVQNHSGYIFAMGDPGEGAVFKVILPA